MEIQFTPLYVDAPKPGKKYGSIKDGGGVRYMIPGGSEGMFAKGQPVNIRYENEPWTNGTGIVKAVNGVQLGEPQAAVGLAPVAAVAPPLPTPPVQATPQPAQGPIINGRYTDQQRAEDIFVTGIVGRVLGGSSGNFGIMDIDRIAKAAVQAWAGRHQGTAPSYDERNPPPADPNDGLPV